MELIDSAPADTQGPPSLEERQPALISRMEQLADVVGGLEARILCRFDSIENQLMKMQADFNCQKCAAAESGDWSADGGSGYQSIAQKMWCTA